MIDRFPVLAALCAAMLFGASTPLAKLLLDDMTPQVLAGLLYAGSGLGLGLVLAVTVLRTGTRQPARLTRADLPWLAGAIVAGGIVAPLLLMAGLSRTSASSASLLLNLEGVFTALLAWFGFRENFDRRIFLGLVLIVAGGALLSWSEAVLSASFLPLGTLLIAAACLCWGVDNNLTRRVSASDPVQIACLKGLVAGGVNLGAAALTGADFPALTSTLAAGLVGLAGYGVSLILFVLALRHLGTARTGAYFSTAPFAGAVLSFLLLGDVPGALFWIAAAFMGAGVWLHLTERHAHAHAHTAMEHAHAHTHDAHHQHDHGTAGSGAAPHSHPHRHAPLTHAHAHYPDIHHRHGHE